MSWPLVLLIVGHLQGLCSNTVEEDIEELHAGMCELSGIIVSQEETIAELTNQIGELVNNTEHLMGCYLGRPYYTAC